MSNISKLMLSDEEQQLVNDPGWILTKRVIIDKVCQLLANAAENQKAVIDTEKNWLPPAITRSTPKIAKGENYLQLPYVLLDYPRCFDVENIFAVRTMFWWGNFFSITLQLSGIYKKMYEEKINRSRDLLSTNEFYLCIGENQWEHHFEEDNYQQLKGFTVGEYETLIRINPFIKLAVKFPLQQWNDIPVLLDRSFKEIIEMLKD